MLTTIQACCTLRTTMGLAENVLSKNICFYKYAHNSSPKGSPDMILTAFEMKFDEKKDEMPPKARRFPTKSKNMQKISKMQQEIDPARPPERGLGGAARREEKKSLGIRAPC